MTQTQPEIERLLNQGRFRECLKIYIEHLRKERNPKNLANLAACLYKLSRFRAAKAFATEALGERLDSCPQATLVLAHIEYDRKNYLKAWRLYKVLVESSLRENAFNGLAMVCVSKNKFDMAEKILIGLIENGLGSALSYKHLTQIYFVKEQFAESWKQIRKWLDASPLCVEAWEAAYACALKLKEPRTARLIAQKLIELNPANPNYYERQGLSLNTLSEDSRLIRESFRSAHELSPDNLVYCINSLIACSKIATHGGYAHRIIYDLMCCANRVFEFCRSKNDWIASGDYPLLNSAFYAAYSPVNLRQVYEPYYKALMLGFKPLLDRSYAQSAALTQEYFAHFDEIDRSRSDLTLNTRQQRIRIGFISKNFWDHSNTQAFSGFIKYLDRERFEVILIHKYPTRSDSSQAWLNSLADEVIYLGSFIGESHALLCRLDLDVLFFTDLGMDAWDFVLPEMRACKIQVTGWGLPHTSGLHSIDYYFSSSLLESSTHQDEYTEKLVLLEGLPCCYLPESLYYKKLPREYFLLPSNQLVIGCVQSLSKVHPDLDLIIEDISRRVPDAWFAFICDRDENATACFRDRLVKRAPTAFRRTLFLDRCFSKDFLSLCDCFDFMLDTPYYGAGITFYMSCYVGTPVVCFQGTRLRDSTTSAIYRYLKIKNAPVARSIPDYVNIAVELSLNFDLRLQIKKDTVSSAAILYDQQDFIRSFEAFCINLLR